MIPEDKRISANYENGYGLDDLELQIVSYSCMFNILGEVGVELKSVLSLRPT